MADSKEQPQQAGKRVGRRTFLTGAAGALAVLTGIGGEQTAKAQMRPMPGYEPTDPPGAKLPSEASDEKAEKQPRPEAPIEFNERIESVVKTARNFIHGSPGIELDFFPVEEPVAYGAYKSNLISEVPLEYELYDYSLDIYYPKDEKMWGYAYLLCAKEAGKLVSRGNNNYPADMFTRDFKKYSGFDLNDLDPEKAEAAIPIFTFQTIEPNQKVEFPELANFFEFQNYTEGVKKENIEEIPGKLSELWYAKSYALWTVMPDKLAAKIEQAPSQTGQMLSNIFLSGLIRTLDCAEVGVKFESLGLDRNSIDRVLEISGDEVYKNYIKEKVEFMGIDVSRVPRNIDEYRIAFAQRSAKAA